MKRQPFGYRGKRALDIAMALVLLLALCPIMTIVAIAIALRMGRPVIFTQQRAGWNKKPFSIYKFRSMQVAHPAAGKPLPDGARLTRLGAFLRASSLDELPELVNVLKGDMSIVGPRPLLMRDLPYYTQREQLRFTVRPGLTGWAQINGRNDLGWAPRLECDAWYAQRCSLSLDLTIVWRTSSVVLRRSNVQVDSSAIEGPLSAERELSDINVQAKG